VGAKRSALIYSLACSCRLNGINTFEYFTDILNRMTCISPNASDDVYRELLPNYWKNNQKKTDFWIFLYGIAETLTL